MSKPQPLAVVIDRTPDSILSPNSGKHERTKRPYRHILRDAGAVAAGNTLGGLTWSWAGPIVVRIEIYWEAGRNRLDIDNAIAACKGAIDGVFAKLEADDRQMIGVYLTQQWDPDRDGYMIVMVEAVDEIARAA